MTRQSRGHAAFTLVELLVVIVIIVMLMGLIMAGLGGAREAGRRATCVSNQTQIALAAVRYSNANGSLPGWRNPLVTSSGTLFPSWPVMLLPNMERKDVYGAITPTYLSFYVCPSSPPDSLSGPVLSYVGSAGAGKNDANLRGSGVMLDLTATGSNAASVSVDEVANADGSAMTLLLSEECGRLITTSGSWNVQPAAAGTGVNWGTATPVFGMVGNTRPAKVINSGTTGSATVPGANNMPSSNHPGGVVAAFCDGHVAFLKDSLRGDVYGQLMSWNHAGVTATPYTGWVGTYSILQEADFQ